jgi:ATPase components of various ABC-type transport systems, contain duplicated ATPase
MTDTTVRVEAPARPGWLRDDALLTVTDLECTFRTASGPVHAVRGVTFDVLPGETLGIVGESGCGKTTTGRAVLQLPRAQGGSVVFDGEDLRTLRGAGLRRARRKLQMVFQDALSSFNPRRKVVDIVGEGLEIQGMSRAQRRARIEEVLEQVGMSAAMVGDRRPHEFSGGQCQRLSIARALALGPKLIVCDEPVASLDVSVQARVLNVLQDIREQNDLSLIFISHDLAVVRIVSDRIAVMYRGRIVEIGAADQVYERPAHPYTRKLLDAVPVIDESERPATLRVEPSVVDADWAEVDHALVEVDPGHYAAMSEAARDAFVAVAGSAR